MRFHQNLQHVTITQRARGVFLCHWLEDKDGVEEWEAFSTLAKAKRWCADKFDRRPEWETQPGDESRWPAWFAEEEFDGDEIYEDD